MNAVHVQRSRKYFVIGCGSIGRRHAANLKASGAEVILAYDPNGERLMQVAEELGLTAVTSVSDGFDRHPDAVFVCAPTGMHLELAREAVRRDCAVFLEKPLSDSLKGVGELLDEISERGLIFLVGLNLRFDPLISAVKQRVQSGSIGDVASARFHFGSYLPSRHPWEDYRLGYGARKDLGGGVILDAIHEIDLAHLLFGSPESVYCVMGKYSDLEINVEDTAEVLLKYSKHVVSIHLDFIQNPYQRWFEIIGSRGSIRVDMKTRIFRLVTFDKTSLEEEQIAVQNSVDDVYKMEILHFLACLDGLEVPRVNAFEATESLLTAVAAKESGTSGEPVSLRNRRIELGERFHNR